jgi:hypothetical protein
VLFQFKHYAFVGADALKNAVSIKESMVID